MNSRLSHMPKAVNWGGRALRLIVALTLLLALASIAAMPGPDSPETAAGPALTAKALYVLPSPTGPAPVPQVNWNS